MQVGDGTVESLDDYNEATGLIQPRYNVMIVSKERVGTSVKIVGSIDSAVVDSEFCPKELGLYAEDADGEFLFAVTYNEGAQPIPAKMDDASIEDIFQIWLAVSDRAMIRVVMPTDAAEIVKLVQDNAIKSIDAAEQAAKSESSANAAAERATKEAQNAAVSAENASLSAASAKETASSIAKTTADDVQEAKNQASAAAGSAQTAQEAKATAEELYRCFCVDIVGPPASAMNEADLFVAPGAAAMAAMK
nr:MAG TPA: hypothetical protein [Caudoviricetes sp.]